MRLQLAIFCLFAMNEIAANRNNDGCRSESCRKHLGVYLLYTNTSVPNVNEYEVVTFHADGAYSYINSLADGTLSPAYPPYSNGQGAWKCAGQNRITATGIIFVYPKGAFPRSLVKAVYSFQFDGNDRFSGSAILTFYNESSTENQDQSQWITILEPIFGAFKGYKLFDICDD